MKAIEKPISRSQTPKRNTLLAWMTDGDEDIVKRCDLEKLVVRATGLSKKGAKKLSKLDLLTVALDHKLISQAQFVKSAPSLHRTRAAYLHSLLDPKMWSTVDEYVRFANALYARGSLVLNMFVGDLVDDAADGTTDAIEFLTDATYLKTIVWPSEHRRSTGNGDRGADLGRAFECIASWWEVNGALVDRLVDPGALRKFAGTRDQMLNVFQRTFIGEMKTHVTCHMPERLVRLFSAVYARQTESETKTIVEAACNAVLTNRRDGLPESWSRRVLDFRRDMGISDDLMLACDDVEALRTVREALEDVDVDGTDDDGRDDQIGDSERNGPCCEEDDETSDVRDLKTLWPIHCRVASVLDDMHRQQVRDNAVEGKRVRPIKTISLLPLHSYRRQYVLIEERVMAALVRIRNRHKRADEGCIALSSDACSLRTVLQIPSKRDLKNRRRALRNRGVSDRQPVRGSRCGYQYHWPTLDGLTSIRTDGVGVRLLFDLKGQRRSVKTFDAWTEAAEALKDCRDVAGCGADPGDVVAVQTEAVSLRGVDPSSASPEDFWTRPSDDERRSVSSIGTLLSSRTYYRRGGVDRTVRWTRARQSSMPVYQEACRALAAAGTWRTSDPSTFRAMCWTLNEHVPAFRAYDLDTVEAAKQRMWVFRRKRSSLDQAAQRIVQSTLDAAKAADHEMPDGIVIAYGNASTRTVRGRRCVPKKELLTALRRAVERVKADRGVKAFLLSVAEKRTTMLCHRCHHVMGTFVARHQDRPGRTITDRNIRGCTHCGTPATPMVRSRDGNAARNILYKAWIKLMDLPLPEAFSSTDAAPRPENLGRAPRLPRGVAATAA